jgi:hypothetical protein
MDMPDKVIAFDELPQSLIDGLEMHDCSKMPKDWREFIGIREKHIRIPPDRDPLTGQVRTYTPLIQKAPYAYLVDREVNFDRDRWAEIESYVKRCAPKDFRLMDKIFDMAKPLARDPHSEIDLETDQVIVIPLPKIEEKSEPEAASVTVVEEHKCDQCEKTFEKKQALRMHKMKRHPEKEPIPT